MTRNQVNEAFEILLGEIEKVVDILREEGAEAFRSGNYDGAQVTLEKAKRLEGFRGKVEALQKEWQDFFGGVAVPQGEGSPEVVFTRTTTETPAPAVPPKEEAGERREGLPPGLRTTERTLPPVTRKATGGERLPPGLRTPTEAFRRPILETLVELGGRASVREVLERVEAKMEGVLNRYDYELLPKSRAVRWENNAQWCRKRLVLEGLMKSDSPTGVWEISDAGRRWLKQGDSKG